MIKRMMEWFNERESYMGFLGGWIYTSSFMISAYSLYAASGVFMKIASAAFWFFITMPFSFLANTLLTYTVSAISSRVRRRAALHEGVDVEDMMPWKRQEGTMGKEISRRAGVIAGIVSSFVATSMVLTMYASANLDSEYRRNLRTELDRISAELAPAEKEVESKCLALAWKVIAEEDPKMDLFLKECTNQATLKECFRESGLWDKVGVAVEYCEDDVWRRLGRKMIKKRAHKRVLQDLLKE